MDSVQRQLRPQDLALAKDIKCEACEATIFQPVFVIKNISALVSPTGKETNVPLQTFACAKCSHVNKDFLPDVSA